MSQFFSGINYRFLSTTSYQSLYSDLISSYACHFVFLRRFTTLVIYSVFQKTSTFLFLKRNFVKYQRIKFFFGKLNPEEI